MVVETQGQGESARQILKLCAAKYVLCVYVLRQCSLLRSSVCERYMGQRSKREDGKSVAYVRGRLCLGLQSIAQKFDDAKPEAEGGTG